MKRLYQSIICILVCASAGAQALSGIKAPKRVHNTAPARAIQTTAADEPTWSTWETAGTGTFTMDDGFELFLGLDGYEGDHPGITVEKRHDLMDESIQQFRLNGIFNNATIIFDYNDVTGQVIVNPQEINIDYFDIPGCALKVVDSATLWPVLGPGAGYDQATIDYLYSEYASYNYFIPTLGRLYVYLSFFYDGYNEAVCLSDCQFQFDGYPDFTPGISLDKYVTPATAKAGITFPEQTSYTLCTVCDRPYNQSVLNGILSKGEEYENTVKITEPGEISLPVTAVNRVSDLVVITFDDKGNPLEMNSRLFTVIDEEAGQWTSLGYAPVYTDIIESTVFEKEGNSYKIEVQQNNDNKALYRVVDLYGESSPLTAPEHLHTALPHYLVFDTTDPEMVLLAHTDLGIDMGAGSFYVYADATDKLYNNKTAEQIKAGGKCGTFTDGIIEFPADALYILADDFSVFGGTKGAAYGCGGFRLNLNELGGVEGIIADSDEPAVYYNLQGIQVENPTAGIYICRQGTTTTKVIVK